MRKLVAALAITLITVGANHASADTTYYYVGQPYTTNADPAKLGTNMTGSVTFDFDTTGVSGKYFLSSGHITELQLTSGVYSVDINAFSPIVAYFTLTSGTITGWDTVTTFTNPILSSGYSLIGSTLPFAADQIVTGGGPGVVIGAWNGFTADHGIQTGGNNNPGTWTIGATPAPPPPNDPLARNNVPEVVGVPGPIVGAGLPGFLMAVAGFIAWRRGRRAIAA